MQLRAVLVAVGGVALATFALLAPAQAGTWTVLVEYPLPLGMFWLAGVLATLRRPDHPVARKLLLGGTIACGMLGLTAAFDAAWPAAASRQLTGGAHLLAWLVAAGIALAQDLGLPVWLDLLVSYPDGRPPGRWGRPLIGLAYSAGALVALSTLLHSDLGVLTSTTIPVPEVASILPRPVAGVTDPLPVLDSAMFLVLPVAVIAVLVRYAGADEEERRRLRWPLGATGLLGALIVLSVTGLQGDEVGASAAAPAIWGVALSCLPLSLLIGIMRYRALDIDLLIRRSLVHAALWIAIALLYAGAAALFGVAVGGRISVVWGVAVTIAAAMLFQPARERLERLAARLVLGDRIEGYDLVRRLGDSLQSAGDPGELGDRLARTTRQGMDASWVRVWAPPVTPVPAGAESPLAVAGTDADGAAPVLVAQLPGGGRIECGRRRSGDYRPEDAQLLATLARQAGPAVANARLTAELAASRARLVQAETEQRRKIERDIHDGVQQQMVALMSRLTVARVQLAGDPERAAASLEEMQEDFRQAVADLRDLASGIHPAVLTDSGLLAAVEARAARMPLGVSIQWEAGPPGRRFDPDVESAAYFVCSEALANVLKHADAGSVDVRICAADGRLELEVRDDGRGLDPVAVTARGLRGLADRLEALGGELRVTSSPGAGTTLHARLNLHEDIDHG